MTICPRMTRSVFLRGIYRIRIYSTSSRAQGAAQVSNREWLAIIPDFDGVLEKRMEVRPRHLEAIKPRIEEGSFQLGGALLGEASQSGEELRIIGSVLLARAESREEVLHALRKDIYSIRGVWDLDNAQILPFKTAMRHNAKID